MAMNDDIEKKIRDAPVTIVRPRPADVTDNPLEQAGIGARQFVDRTVNIATTPQRFASAATGALSGQAAHAGQALARGFTGSTAQPATPLASDPPATSRMVRPGAPKPVAPGVPFNTGQTGDAKLPTQPSIGYFIGSDKKRRDITAQQAEALAGRVQTVPSAAAAAGAAGAPRGAPLPAAAGAQQAESTLRRPDAFALGQQAIAIQRQEADAVRNTALRFTNPMSMESELMRRRQNAENSYFNKGSPGGRAREVGKIDAVIGSLIGAGETRQQQVGQTAAGAATQEANLGATAVEGAAGRAATAADSAQRAQLQREQLDAAAPVLQLQGGTTARIGRDGVVRNLVGEDGQPVRAAQQASGLDPNEVFKAAVAQRGEIANNPLLADPEARAAALAEFDAGPLGQAIAAALPSSPQGAGASQIPPEAIAILRQNPGKAAEFESTFNLPAGAAAQYLGK